MDKDIRARSIELQRRSARLRADVAALHMECARISARVDAKRRLLLAADNDAPAADPHDAAMDVLRGIRATLDGFPLEWQIAIVKALTARTLIKAREQTQAPSATILSA